MKSLKSKKPAAKKPVGNITTENGSSLGTIKIHENVIAAVVKKVTLDVDGVSRLAGSSLVENIAEFVGSKKGHGSIAVDIEESSVRIEVKVNIFYGAHIPTVAQSIQSVVIDEVGKSTGMTVSKVDVVVQEIEDQKNSEDDDDK
jgi:uncharacterized alkaline shock family protein YloU